VKGTPTYNTLLAYGELAERMYTKDKFSLMIGNHRIIEYETGKPFRCACTISNYGATMTLFAKDDVCEICTQKYYARTVEPKIIFDMMEHSYGQAGIQALRFALVKRGHLNAVTSKTASAIAYVEEKLFPVFTTDLAELVLLIYKDGHRRAPKHTYRRRAIEDATDKELIKNVVMKPIENLESKETIKPVEEVNFGEQ